MERVDKRYASPAFISMMFLIMLVIYLGGSYAVSYAVYFLSEKNPDFSLSIAASVIISQALIWLGMLAVLLIGRKRIFNASDFRFKSSAGRTIATFALVPVFTGAIMPSVWFLNLVTMFFAENKIATTTDELSVYPLLVQLLLMALLPAVSEELICRGALFGGLKRYGILRAIIISSLFFGILHLNINQFAYATALGIYFCILNEATGCIYSSMVAHFTVNGFSVVVTYLMTFLNEKMIENGTAVAEAAETSADLASMPAAAKILVAGVYGVMAIMGLIVAALLIWAISGINGRTKHVISIFSKKTDNPYGENRKGMFNIFFWIAVVLGLGYMIITEYFWV